MATQAQGLSLFEAARRMGVPFQREVEPQNKEVTVNGMKFHYLDWGTEGRQPLVFLHGNSQQAHSWDFISLAICDNYHCMAPDARGHGDSDWAPQGEYTVDAYVQDLAGFVDALGLEQIILLRIYLPTPGESESPCHSGLRPTCHIRWHLPHGPLQAVA